MDKYLVVWPRSEEITHINYHYTQLGEVVDYLDKFFPGQIVTLDCDISDENIIQFIRENKIKKVIMQVNYENAQNAFYMCDNIKKNLENIPILAYGNIPNRLPKLFLESNFDGIHTDGDVEVCIKSFIRGYERDKEIVELQGNIVGANIISDGQFVSTGPGKYIMPDSWGISKQKNVPIDEYDKIKKKDRYILNISRGCPFGCSHCLIQLTEGRIERRRSIENVKQSIEEIKKNYKHIKIWAANFTLDKKYVEAFCNMMKIMHPDVTWECATRVDLAKDEEMLKKMYEAGCRQISLGIESLNNKELINTKDFKVDELSATISKIQKNGIQVKGCVMLGMPNQTKESIISTLKFLRSRNVIIRPTIYTPYHNIPEDVKISDLGQFNRKTYINNNVKGVTSEQLFRLVKNPYNFEEILDIPIQNKNEQIYKSKK